MAYLPQVENDIYISYTRVDNLPDPTLKEGIVDVFHKYLDVELSRLIGRVGAINTWKNAHGDEGFFTAIERAIKQSAIFVALVSNNYVSSQFCQRELQT